MVGLDVVWVQCFPPSFVALFSIVLSQLCLLCQVRAQNSPI